MKPMEWETINPSWENSKTQEKEEEAPKTQSIGSQRRSEIKVRPTKSLYRRAFSETQLLDLLGFDEFKQGYQYNFITGGDVDALSYLKAILRHQNLDYCLFSTWVMATEDILQFDDWLREGKIKKCDAYLGEVFPGGYPYQYKKLKEVWKQRKAGRIAVFKNHSKIFAGYGDKFYFGIQTSANINTNPRAENGCITIDKGLFEFYKEYFDGIKTIGK